MKAIKTKLSLIWHSIQKHLELLLLCIFVSCIRPPDLAINRGFSDAKNELFILNTLAESISIINIDTYETHNDVIIAGKWANSIIVEDDIIYIVNSGDNNISIISENSFTNIDTLSLGNNNNPWNVVSFNERLYTANFVSGKVFMYSILSNRIIASNVLKPGIETLKICQGKLFICSTGYSITTGDFTDSSLYVLDPFDLQIIKNISVPANPQDILDVPSIGEVDVICTGENGKNDGYISIIDTASLIVKTNIFVGGSPAYCTADYINNIGYFSKSGSVGSYSLLEHQLLNSLTDPLLNDTNKLYTDLVVDEENSILYIANFTDDRIIVFDLNLFSVITNIEVSDGPISLFLYKE